MFFSGRRLTKAFRVHQGWIASCWIRNGITARAHCLRRGLWPICQGLDEALLLSLLLLHLLQRLDGTADSESSAQPATQRVVLDPSSRSLSSKVTAVSSDSSLSSRPELVQRSVTMTAPLPCLQSMRAECVAPVSDDTLFPTDR